VEFGSRSRSTGGQMDYPNVVTGRGECHSPLIGR
jgi:hypothetical protein